MIKISVLVLVVCILILWAFFSFMSGNNDLGIFLVVVSILLICFVGLYWKDDVQELKEMYNKQEQESIYETELIKERARLQAQKEFKQHKKK